MVGGSYKFLGLRTQIHVLQSALSVIKLVKAKGKTFTEVKGQEAALPLLWHPTSDLPANPIESYFKHMLGTRIWKRLTGWGRTQRDPSA